MKLNIEKLINFIQNLLLLEPKGLGKTLYYEKALLRLIASTLYVPTPGVSINRSLRLIYLSIGTTPIGLNLLTKLY